MSYSGIYFFRPFYLDAEQILLFRDFQKNPFGKKVDWQEVPLQKQTALFLKVLLENRNTIQSIDALLEKGWKKSLSNRTVVGQVHLLRNALDEYADCIKTWQRRGYSFEDKLWKQILQKQVEQAGGTLPASWSGDLSGPEPAGIHALDNSSLQRLLRGIQSNTAKNSLTLRESPLDGTKSLVDPSAVEKLSQAMKNLAEQLLSLGAIISNTTLEPGMSTDAPRPRGNVWFDPDSKTLWRTAKSVLLPINTTDLDENAGRLGALRRIEIPRKALEEAVLDRPDLLMSKDVYEFLRDVWSHPKKYHSIIAGRPALKKWVEGIWAVPSSESKNLERIQLQKFYQAMQSPQISNESLPDFTYDEVSCWRIFMQAFPESVSLLEVASANKAIRYTQRMALASLSSTLAMTTDWRISSRATAVSVRLMREFTVSTVYSYRQYQLVRHLLYTAVEAGEFSADNFLKFVRNHPVKWEFDLNRDYYKDYTDATMALTIVRKLDRPFNRDEWTKKISEYHRDILPKKLVDEAYRKMHQPSLAVAPMVRKRKNVTADS